MKTLSMVLISWSSTLFGQVLFDNLSDASQPQTVGNSSFLIFAERFSTGTSTTSLTDITLKLKAIASAGTYTVNLYGDNGMSGNLSAPGSFLATVATANINSLPSSSYTDAHSSGLSLAVAPSTAYWITLSTDATAHTLDWAFSHTAKAGMAYSYFTSGSWNTTGDGSYPQQMRVLGAVPEPRGYALAATLGLLGFALWRRLVVKTV